MPYERAVIQNPDPRLHRRSYPWDGCNRVRPPQETKRPASIDVGHDVRWNAGHHGGHGVLETPGPRGDAAGTGSRAAGTLPPHRARQQRPLRRASSTRAIADAVAAVLRTLPSAPRPQTQPAEPTT